MIRFIILLISVTPAFAQYKVDAPPPPLEKRISDIEWRLGQIENKLGMYKTTPHVATPQSVVVPPGQHAHRTTDGQIIIHGNENVGNATAHQGIAYPWIRTAEAGQTVSTGSSAVTQSSSSYSMTYSSNCPNGVCPTGRQPWRPFNGFFIRGN